MIHGKLKYVKIRDSNSNQRQDIATWDRNRSQHEKV